MNTMKRYIPLLALLLLACQQPSATKDPLDLELKLAGKWKARAFSGELHDEWRLGSDGWMQQSGHYIEEGDTSYSAITRIEQVGDDVILYSVIRNSNPKIFRASSMLPDKIIFENDDYKNPFRVTYEFLGHYKYRRTIQGYEQDSLVSYVFDFRRME